MHSYTLTHFLFTFFSPCSGLVISGYAKTLPDKSWNTDLSKAIKPYKNFKKMYSVDKTGDFEGTQEIFHKFVFYLHLLC